MARGKKTEPAPEIDADNLPQLSPQEFEFVNLLMFDPSVKGDGSAAYRRAFPDRSQRNNTVWCEASKLKNSAKVRQWINAIKLAQMDRLESSRDQYIADIQSDIQAAQASGNFGAAATLRVALGKVLGHLIERSEDINRTRDQMANLKAIAKAMDKDSAIKWADSVGLKDQMLEVIQTEGNA